MSSPESTAHDMVGLAVNDEKLGYKLCFKCARAVAICLLLHSNRFSPSVYVLVAKQSESLHREAYNAVFREFEVDYNWSPEYYDELQNKERAVLIYFSSAAVYSCSAVVK